MTGIHENLTESPIVAEFLFGGGDLHVRSVGCSGRDEQVADACGILWGFRRIRIVGRLCMRTAGFYRCIALCADSQPLESADQRRYVRFPLFLGLVYVGQDRADRVHCGQ